MSIKKIYKSRKLFMKRLIIIKGEPEKEIKRVLGLIILRGETILTITAEAPPIQ